MKNRSSQLIFVTGASRSGTTLLSFVLRNNSSVFGLKELHYFGDVCDPNEADGAVSQSRLVEAAAAIYARQNSGVLARSNDERFRAHAEELVAALEDDERNLGGVFLAATKALSRSAGKSIPCEHTPRNIFYAKRLLELFPEAHVVHVMRDPRGVMASQKQRWRRRKLAENQEEFRLAQTVRVWVNYHPYTIARLWRRATEQAQQLRHHERFTVVRFEDLLLDPKLFVAKLCDTLGIEFEPDMLDIGQVNSSHQSSVGGARRGFNPQAVKAWRDCLTPAEVAITEELCGDLMRDFGYKSEGRFDGASQGRLRYQLGYVLHLAGVAAVNPRRAWIQTRALLSGGSQTRKAQG